MKATQPDNKGHFGKYGGMYVPETLMEPLNELTRVFKKAKNDPLFKKELQHCLREYVGRPTPLCLAERDDGGARHRSDLSQTRRSLPYRRA